jgi:RHH-type proline utilization regulon transcriptional repressor/proline dehydrogenase/delta 1-pyrroline-5-carboxylate dehydrogenase
VIFTGSTDVARGIARALAPRADDPVLIAETGGQNAMIVDSSALAEQVVADALVSAFDSAGQRCSALRLLCVQDDVAPEMLAMLEGAMRELAVGDPRRLAVDVGPSSTRTRAPRSQRTSRACVPPDCAWSRWRCRGVRARHVHRAHARRSRRHRRAEAPSSVKCSARSCMCCVGGAASSCARRRHQRDRLRPDARNSNAHRRDRRGDPRANQGRQRLCQSGTSWAPSSACSPSAGTGFRARDRRPGAALPAAARAQCDRAGADIGDPVARSTGESNTLEFHPRGVVLCLARDERTLVAQAKAALAFGNKVMMLREPNALAARDRLEPFEVMLTDKLDPAAVDAVLLDVSAERARRVRTEFATAKGSIVPIVNAGAMASATGRASWSSAR